jgi:hypothetical protein
LDAKDETSGMACRIMDDESGGFDPPGIEERKRNMQIN